MSTIIEKLVADALSLGPEARAFLAERLIESLDETPDAVLSSAWREEVRRRCRELDDRAFELRDAADVFERAQTSLE